MANAQSETVKWLTPAQLETLFSKIEAKRDKALFFAMYTYGLRCIEASRLRLSDVRLEDDRIYINAAKNGKSGEFLLSKKVKRQLVVYLKERGTREGALFLSRKKNNDRALSTMQIYRLFQKYAKKARIPKDRHHPHVLRHSVAVHMADSGVPQEHVRELLRHRKISSTDIYYEITNKKRNEFLAEAWEGEFVVTI